MTDRGDILTAVIQKVSGEISQLEVTLAQTEAAIKTAPSAMESHSDTSRNQLQDRKAELLIELNQKKATLVEIEEYAGNLHRVSVAVGSGSLIKIESGARTRWYLLMKGQGGTVVPTGQGDVLTLNMTSPLGAVLISQEAGDQVKLNDREMEILEVI